MNSRIVTNGVTNWFSLKVRFVLLKYNTSNLALNVPSHVFHLTGWGPRMIDQIGCYKRMSNVFFIRLAVFIAFGVLANRVSKSRVNFI